MAFVYLVLTVFGLLGYLIYLFFVINFDYWKKRGVIGPKPRPFFGNTPNLILQKKNFNEDFNEIYREYKGKDRFVGIFNIRKPQVLIIDPKLVQEILITKFKSFNQNEFSIWADEKVDPILCRNPFLLTGEAWKEKRGEITPALTTNRIKASYPIMLTICEKMRKYLEKETQIPPKDGFEAKELCAKFTTEVVSNCIFGIEAGAFTSDRCMIREMGAAVLDQSTVSVIYMMIMSCLPNYMRGIYKRPFVKKNIQDFFLNLMDEAIKIRKETKSDRVDFLNYLLQLQEKKNLSYMDLAGHTLTFFLDGFETSSLLISNCLRCLAEYPECQQKLREEINKAIEEDGEITYEKLLELPYLEQCINESLRLYSPALTITKIATENCELTTSKDKKVEIEEGTVIVLPYYALQNDPEYYPDPEKFDPERFSEENGGAKKYRDMGVFLPFGDGPRICLGMKFGLCQSKAAIVEFVRNWEMSLNPKTKPGFKMDPKYFMCAPEGGNWIDFKRIRF